MPELKDLNSWTEHLRRSKLRTFTHFAFTFFYLRRSHPDAHAMATDQSVGGGGVAPPQRRPGRNRITVLSRSHRLRGSVCPGPGSRRREHHHTRNTDMQFHRDLHLHRSPDLAGPRHNSSQSIVLRPRDQTSNSAIIRSFLVRPCSRKYD
jgi:hypothetical protein